MTPKEEIKRMIVLKNQHIFLLRCEKNKFNYKINKLKEEIEELENGLKSPST